MPTDEPPEQGRCPQFEAAWRLHNQDQTANSSQLNAATLEPVDGSQDEDMCLRD